MGKVAVSGPRLGFPEHRLGAGRKLERVEGEGACQADPTSPLSLPTPGALELELLHAGPGQSVFDRCMDQSLDRATQGGMTLGQVAI